MSFIIEQTLPYTSKQLTLDNSTRWTRILPLMRPSIKIVKTSGGQFIALDTVLSKSENVLVAVIGKAGNISSKILNESQVAAFTSQKLGPPVDGDELLKILKQNGFPTHNGLVILRSDQTTPLGWNTTENFTELTVEGELELDHALSLISATKPEVRASYDKTGTLLGEFGGLTARATSTFHEEKSGSMPSVARRIEGCIPRPPIEEIIDFNSAKKGIENDLNHLLDLCNKSPQGTGYSVHYSDINGLSRLENNILAHEISQYFENKNLPLYLSQSTIYPTRSLTRGYSISVCHIPMNDLSPLLKPTAPLTDITSTTSPKTITSSPTHIPLYTPDMMKAIIISGCNNLISSEPKITHYDTLVGDGDCGTTLSSGATFVLNFLSSLLLSSLSPESLANTISKMVEELEINMGGTSGALYCIFLSSLASQLKDEGWETFPQALRGALRELCKFTRARRGDRTMMDCLIPFVEGLNGEGKGGKGGKEQIMKAIKEARNGVEGTRNMEASLGRSSYLDESATRGVPDPGAYGLLMLLEGMVEGLG